MTDSARFKQVQCYDDRPMVTQERALLHVLAFSGIHISAAEDAILETTGATTNFEDTEGTWVAAGGALQGTGAGAARWYKIRHKTEVELGFVAEFDKKTGNRGAFLFCSDDDYDGYLVWWTATAVGISDINETTETVLCSLPLAETGAAHVTVGVWPRRMSSEDTAVDDIVVGLWFDGKQLLMYAMEYEEKGNHVGFAVYQADVITFDNLHLPQLHQVVEWTSVDPGEVAGAGLSRIIGYEQIRVQARYDGSVRIWRNTGTDVDWTVPEDRWLQYDEQQQAHGPTHLRMVGALHEVDVFRAGDQGHVFALAQDPNAMSAGETEARGERRHKAIEEEQHMATALLPPNPVIEAEDVISLDSTSWRVTAINFRAAWRGDLESGAPVLESNMQLRECLA